MTMKVGEIMSGDAETLRPNVPIAELEERLISHRVGCFPVVEAGALVGMVTRSDLVRVLDLEHTIDAQLGDAVSAQLAGGGDSASERGARIGARLEAMTVGDVMIHDVVSVARDAPVAEAARLMVERNVHHLPVVDGTQLVGVVTSLDLSRLVAEGAVS